MKNQCTRRLTPLMGWASWNCFRTDISEERMRAQADALVETGLAECGYTYLNMDDGFFGGRDAKGKLLFHGKRFPNGIKPVADYAHSLGLKAGIYAEAGDNTCGYYYDAEGRNGEGVGLYGHEEADLRRYLEEFGFDFIKVDWCGGVRLGLSEEEQYTKIGRIIEKLREETGRSLVYNICRWQFPGPWAVSVADSWRTAADISPEFSSILHQLDNIKPLRKYCGPGHVNDLDMMQVGNGMAQIEEKTHFSMWCMMSAPLIVGCDLTKIGCGTLEILKNREMIAVNQDSACLQAFVVKEFRSGHDGAQEENRDALREREETSAKTGDAAELVGEIWVKDLGEANSRKKAVAFLNRSDEALTMAVEASEIGLGGRLVRIRDLWRHEEVLESAVEEDAGQHLNQYQEQSQGRYRGQCPEWYPGEYRDQRISECGMTITVEPRGVEVFLFEGETAIEPKDVFALSGGTDIDVTVEEITGKQMEELLREGAVLVDVRTEAEYATDHEAGAVNLPYMDIHGMASGCLHDKNRPVIVYCATGKRCSQAGQSLKYLGYRNVYRWKRENSK